MADSSFTSISYGNDEYEHVVRVLFESDQQAIAVFKEKKIVTIDEALDFCSQHNLFNSLKWKTKNANVKEVDDRVKEMMMDFPNFLMWLQNDYATLIYPVPLITRGGFTVWKAFRRLKLGTVDYDPIKALESEERNQIGIFARSAIPSTPVSINMGGSTNNTTGGTTDTKLDQFKKTVASAKLEFPKLETNAGYRGFAIAAKAFLKLNDLYPLVSSGYVAPLDLTTPEGILHEKKNTWLWILLNNHVTSSDGKAIVKTHSDNCDGISAWNDLVALHCTDVSASHRAAHFKSCAATMVADEYPKKGYLTTIDNFLEIMNEHDAYCEPGREIDDHDRLTYLERFLATIDAFRDLKIKMDLEEDPVFHPGQPKRTSKQRIQYYKRFAITLDRSQKDKTLSHRRNDKSFRAANMTEVELYDYIEGGMDLHGPDSGLNAYSSERSSLDASLSEADWYYANRADAGEGRREGFLPKAIYQSMDPKDRESWMSIPSKVREQILTWKADTPSLPSAPKSGGLRPGVARKARVNLSQLTPDDADLVPVDVDDEPPREVGMTLIEALKSKTKLTQLPVSITDHLRRPVLANKHCADPTRLMSPQNKSPLRKTRIKPPNVATDDDFQPEDRTVSMAAIEYPTPSLDDCDTGLTVEHPILIVCSANVHRISGLVDGGANGGLANPTEMRLLYYADPTRRVNVRGVGDQDLIGLRIGTFCVKIQFEDGRYALGIFHEYGELPQGKSILSKLQVRDGGALVDDDPILLGGKQCIQTKEGYVIPIDFKNGLPYIKMEYPTDDDLKDLPHVILTSDVPWDPHRYDLNRSDQVPDLDPHGVAPTVVPVHEGFSEFGTLLKVNVGEFVTPSNRLIVPTTGEFLPDVSDPIFYLFNDGWESTYHTTIYSSAGDLANINLEASFGEQVMAPIEYQEYRKFLLNVPLSTVRHTFDATTRYYRYIPATNHMMTYKSPYPALNCLRRHELVASDTVYADTVAWGGNCVAQVFSGKLSRFVSVHPCKTDKDFPRCLEDEIRKRGAMDKLVTDRAQAEISNKVHDILRSLFIDDWQSEPHYHHQLIVERDIQTLKKFVNWTLNWSQAPPEAWFSVFEYVCFIMNRTAKESLNWRTPVEALSGHTPDISMILHFTFWEPVFIKNYQDSGHGFPSKASEIMVRFIGYSEDVGHSCTFKVFNEKTQSILYRSCLRKVDRAIDVAAPPYEPKYPDDTDDIHEESIPEVVKVHGSDEFSIRRSAMISPEELVGRTFLMNVREDGTRSRAKIIDFDGNADIDPMDKYESELERQPERIRFRVKVGDTETEEFVSWSDMCEFIEEQSQEEDGTWRFRKIVGHKKDLQRGQKPELLIMWESGEITYEPIREIHKSDPYLVAEYARDAGVIDDWDSRCKGLHLKRYAKNSKKLVRMINQAKLKSYRETPVYMYGVKVPRNHEQAMQFDLENGNTLWQEAEKTEIDQLFEYECFDDKGHKSTARIPSDYKKIRLHLVYAVKHDGRRKARCVAGGHLTDVPNESVYSGVVSLRGIRMLLFLSELNGMECWCTDIGNAFLESKTTEKVYVIAGGEFGDLKDHVFIIVGALYGLRTSSKRFHERLADELRAMGFVPCYGETDIWMRAMNADGTVMTESDLKKEDPAFTYPGVSVPIFEGYYEYIATYVDDLTIASKDPMAIIRHLEEVSKFKLKGTGPLEFLLGCDFFRDEDGTLCSAPKKYIARMESTYERLFGEKPNRKYHSPLESNDHPELDVTSMCDENDTKIYQSLIGALQWIVSLGRFDIAVHVMSLSSFRAMPRKGHLERVKRVYGYICKLKGATIRYRTDMPDLCDMDFVDQDWTHTVYSGAKEEYPGNLPAARGDPVRQISYVDANLYHDMLSGKSVTAVLHYLNMTPIDWYSKKQATVETATFGSENVAARTAIEQMRTIKLQLLYLGVPVIDKSVLIGDNKSVVEADTQPHSKLHKRHLMLSYHFVREAIASGNYAYIWLNGKMNLADILSKHWGYQAIWPIMKPVLFMQGDVNAHNIDVSDNALSI